MQCAMRCKHLQDQLTDRLTALRGSFRRTIRRSAAEEEKCRLTLVETCDTAHPKRQNAAERGRALYRGRTRAERFCNRCGGFRKRARGRRNAALGGLVGSLRARLALWLCARCSCPRSSSRAFWARRPAFASPRTFPPWRQPLRSRVLAASCNVGQHRRGDQDLEVRVVACGFPWRLLLSSRGSSRAQVVVSGHRRVTSMELHTCTSAALWASVGGRNDCRHGLACSFGAIG